MAALSVPENVGQLEISVELVSVDGGGNRLDGEVIMARISTADIDAMSPGVLSDYILWWSLEYSQRILMARLES